MSLTIKSLRRAARSETSFGRYAAEWLRRNDPHPVSWTGLTKRRGR